jgi:hypothetical protein
MRAAIPLLACLALASAAAAIDSPAEVDASVAVRDVREADGAIEATISNRSPHEISDVRLLIDYIYHWPDETHPGDESPGRAWSHVVPGPIAPGASAPLRFTPPGGLPTAPGRFTPQIEVLGFTHR